MYSIQQRRDISARIANPSNIPTYRRLLKASGNNYGGLINPDERKLAILLVSALLTTYSEEEIIAACQTPAKATETAKAGKSGPSASEAVKKKRSKIEEYPGIHWEDLDNPLVRTADSIFSDAVNLGRWLREAEERLYDQEADAELVAEFVGKAIRLELCHEELRSFSKTGEFKGKHPFIAQRSERDRATALLKENPVEFTREMYRIEMNISRYSSHLNSPKLSPEKKKQAQANLDKFQAAQKMYEEILKTVING